VLLGGCELRFDGVSAPLLFVRRGEIHAQVPYTVAGRSAVRIEALEKGKSAGALDAAVAPAAPGIYPVALNQDGSPNSAAKPAARGGTITFYATGEGLTDGPNVAGQAAEAPYPRPRLKPRVTIGGVEAGIVEAAAAPGVAGILQVVVRVPDAAVASAASAPLKLFVGQAASAEFGVWLK
jgi:uncharacterized protein (TIGR03437 family)